MCKIEKIFDKIESAILDAQLFALEKADEMAGRIEKFYYEKELYYWF